MLEIPRQDAMRILHRLTELQKAMDTGDISAFGIKALQGRNARWRLRFGDHRVVGTVEDGRVPTQRGSGHANAADMADGTAKNMCQWSHSRPTVMHPYGRRSGW
ncbi:type II toxin-antitoxin system RelE family toxin [Thermomonospora echinospora]|uniref:type II toxin-antitoxin system RelE family toxin n=1 Tax=Thermomonospora echinospora TaxID=1992 RepID=UPI00190E759D|nr:hypothetical protein [Thermomonospora echinospora]